MRLSEKKRLGLVLSGGGIKAAAFHVGVCLALEEKGFRFGGGTRDEVEENFPEDRLTFKTYVGSSAGAVISSLLASGHSVEALMDAFEMGTTTLKRRTNTQRVASSTLKPLTYLDVFSVNGFNFFKMIPKFSMK